MLTAQVIGNLGGDPETRTTAGGREVCSFSVASTTGAGDDKRTEWVRVSVWGKQAEMCQQYLAKGRKVYVSGRLSTRSYESTGGEKRFSVDLTADTVQFIDARKEGGAEPVEQADGLDSIAF